MPEISTFEANPGDPNTSIILKIHEGDRKKNRKKKNKEIPYRVLLCFDFPCHNCHPGHVYHF
jgi:hypothetical protein